MAAVNLIGAVFSTADSTTVPDALSAAPSNIRALHKALHEYFEVADRLSLLNDRFSVIQELLELCRTLRFQAEYARLDTIVMWLVGICAVLAVVQLVGFLGWRPSWKKMMLYPLY